MRVVPKIRPEITEGLFWMVIAIFVSKFLNVFVQIIEFSCSNEKNENLFFNCQKATLVFGGGYFPHAAL